MYLFRVNIFLICSFILSSINAKNIEQTFNIDMKSSRIFGGTNAAAGSASYQVSLRRSSGSHYCGGSLISSCHVITAAHCQPGCADLSCKVGYGSNTLSLQTLADVEVFRQHENYFIQTTSSGGIVTIRNDIAIIKLKPTYPVMNNGITSSIPLAQASLALQTPVTTSGWGYILPYVSPQDLQTTTLTVVACPQSQSTWYQFVCTSNLLTGVCPGDSGGPIVFNNRLSGVTSYGSSCGSVPTTDGFTDVFSYRDWIANAMLSLPC